MSDNEPISKMTPAMRAVQDEWDKKKRLQEAFERGFAGNSYRKETEHDQDANGQRPVDDREDDANGAEPERDGQGRPHKGDGKRRRDPGHKADK